MFDASWAWVRAASTSLSTFSASMCCVAWTREAPCWPFPACSGQGAGRSSSRATATSRRGYVDWRLHGEACVDALEFKEVVVTAGPTSMCFFALVAMGTPLVCF